MTPDTLCNWFSMTKLVTATAVVQLAERGELDLDAPAVRYYEPFGAMRPSSRAHQATVRHLLSHSAGVANPIPLRWVHLANENGPSAPELVERLVSRHRRLRFDPGTKAAYTNLGYLMLGEVVARVAAQPFPDYVRDNVLAPLAMANTDFVAVADDRWATPYQRRRTALSALLPLLIPRTIIGGKDARFVALRHFYVDGAAYGGLVGPATDAIRFARAHLAGGELDGVRILSEQACRAMQTIFARGRKLEVGLGWFRRGAAPGADFVEHLGGGAGFWSCLRLYPTRDRAVVVMGNATTYDHEAVVQAVVEASG
jgi:CubicO group peptidase (beta-lactamase class C family)